MIEWIHTHPIEIVVVFGIGLTVMLFAWELWR